MDEMMFCYQCEQAANCTACTGKAGVCGKSAETADAQDRLTGALIGFATLLLDIGRAHPAAAGTVVDWKGCSPPSPTSTSTPRRWRS